MTPFASNSEVDSAASPHGNSFARLLVVIAASFSVGPLAVWAAVLGSGHVFVNDRYGSVYGLLSLSGILLLLILTLTFAIMRSSNRHFTYRALLLTFGCIFLFIVYAMSGLTI